MGEPGHEDPVRRVGVIRDRWAERVAGPVAAGLAAALDRLRAAGIEVVDAHVPDAAVAPALSYVTMLGQSARIWWPRVGPDNLGEDVRRSLALGTHVTDDDRALLARVRASLRGATARALNGLDAVVLPACPVPAARAGQETVHYAGRTVPVATAHAALTAWASCTGLPAACVPAPGRPGELPVGVQVVAERTDRVIAAASLVDGDGMSYMM